MDGELFWYLGGALVLAALVIAYVGIRGRDKFPANGRVMAGALVAFGLLVAVTAAYAVALAREEQEHRNEELAHAEAEAEHGAAEEAAPEPEEGTQEGEAPPEAQQTPSAGASETLELTSPEDGSLAFEPDSFQTGAGSLTLAYSNPSPVPHNVAVEDVEEELLGESETITGAETELQVDVVPGEYVFFCTVPGHREGGMEGVITVQ
jgi:plastocyanin